MEMEVGESGILELYILSLFYKNKTGKSLNNYLPNNVRNTKFSSIIFVYL